MTGQGPPEQRLGGSGVSIDATNGRKTLTDRAKQGDTELRQHERDLRDDAVRHEVRWKPT
jgi:hypothetical protein